MLKLALVPTQTERARISPPCSKACARKRQARLQLLVITNIAYRIFLALIATLILQDEIVAEPTQGFKVVTRFSVEGGIVQAVFVSEQLVVCTQGKAKTFKIINTKNRSQETFYSESGMYAPFEPTLLAPNSGRIILFDAYRDEISEFTTDGNSLKKVKLPRESLSSTAGKSSAITGIAYDKRADKLIALTENGTLFSFGWDGKLNWEYELGTSHLTSLKLFTDDEQIKLYILAPLENRLLKLETSNFGKGDSARQPSVVAIPLPTSDTIAFVDDFLPLKDGSILISYRGSLSILTEGKLAPISLPEDAFLSERFFLSSYKGLLLLYSISGKALIAEMK